MTSNTFSSLEDLRHDATRRLIKGILQGRPQQNDEYVGEGKDFVTTANYERSLSMANRILKSSIGNNLSSTSPNHHHHHYESDDVRRKEAQAWRRIEQLLRAAPTSSSSTSAEEILQHCRLLYQDFQASSGESSRQQRSSIPSQMLGILSQLMNPDKSRQNVSNSNTKRHAQYGGRQQQTTSPKKTESGSQQSPSTATNRLQQEKSPALPSPVRPIYDNSNPEIVLLQECFYCLQGISGDLLYFGESATSSTSIMAHPSSKSTCSSMLCLNHNRATPNVLTWLDCNYVDDDRPNGSSGAMDALRLCGEAGFLCQRIQRFIDSVMKSSSSQSVSMESFKQSNSTYTSKQGQAPTRTISVVAGAVAKALAVALQDRLQQYHFFLAELESKLLHKHQRDSKKTGPSTTNRQQIPTLRCLYAELQQPFRELYSMAMITDGLLLSDDTAKASPLPAVLILSSLYRHCRHGDVRHATLSHSLLIAAAQPWWNMLYAWTTMGLLQDDPFQEFFIAASNDRACVHQSNGDDDRLLWHSGYQLDENKVPEGILDASLVSVALNVGKGINFVRKCLEDTEWTLRWDSITTINTNNVESVIEPSNTLAITDLPQLLGFHHRPQMLSGSLNNAPVLHLALRSASEQVHSHILHVLIEDHHLLHHLWALKQFLLLGQGDFISSLIEALQQAEEEQNMFLPTTPHKASRGSQRWSKLFHEQTLTSIMDGALKSSNAKDLPPYLLERLHVRIVENDRTSAHSDDSETKESLGSDVQSEEESDDSTNANSCGMWDGFLLEYAVPDQLWPIVHPDAMVIYRSVFQFLFGLKTVEVRLDSTWRQSAAIQHALQIHCQTNFIRLANSPGYSQATVLLRHISITRQSMIHLLRNLKSYVMLDVLEGGWKDLVHRIEAATTLDHVIEAHNTYLRGIVRKCWLFRSDSRKLTTTLSNSWGYTRKDSIARQRWKKLLALINEFCSFQEKMFTESLKAAESAAEKRREAEARKDGTWVYQQETTEEESLFFLADESKLCAVMHMSDAFHHGLIELLASLHEKINNPGDQITDEQEWRESSNADFIARQTDLDSIRFLTFQLDYNNYYNSLTALSGK